MLEINMAKNRGCVMTFVYSFGHQISQNISPTDALLIPDNNHPHSTCHFQAWSHPCVQANTTTVCLSVHISQLNNWWINV